LNLKERGHAVVEAEGARAACAGRAAVVLAGRWFEVSGVRRWEGEGGGGVHRAKGVSLPKRFRNGRFTSETAVETATWIQKWFKMPVGTSRKLYL
jgi:hypothetical protein